MIVIIMMVVMLMIVIIPVMMMVVAVGSVLRLKGGLLLRDCPAEPPDHVIKHMVVLVAEIVRGDLERHMAVPEVVGKPGELQRRICPHGRDLLRRSLDKEKAPVLIAEHRAAADNQPALEEDDALRSVLRLCDETAAPALVDGKGDRIAPAELMPRGGIFLFPRILENVPMSNPFPECPGMKPRGRSIRRDSTSA